MAHGCNGVAQRLGGARRTGFAGGGTGPTSGVVEAAERPRRLSLRKRPQKLLFDWTAEREYWRARRTEVEKDRPHRSELIDLCKQQEAAAESMIRQIESRLKNPPPVSMVRPTVSSVERIKERPRRSEPTPRRAVPDGR